MQTMTSSRAEHNDLSFLVRNTDKLDAQQLEDPAYRLTKDIEDK